MAEISAFVQIHGEPRLIEVKIAEGVTEAELRAALVAAGVALAPEMAIFFDEGDEPLEGEKQQSVRGLKHGCRIHVSHCRRIKTVVHYLEKSATREFAPGTRVRAVKVWAVREFHIAGKDAAEHVLQLCQSVERPASDTPLHTLVKARECAVCFDLVPEQRVEG